MAEDTKDYRDRWEDEEDEDVGKEPVKPFYQTLIGKIAIGLAILIGIVLLQIAVTLIVDSIIEDQEEDLTDEQLTEEGPPLVENAQTFSLGEMNLNLENPGAYLSVEVYLAYDGNQQNLRYELDKRSYHITSIVRHILESNTSQDIDSVNERNNILKPKIKNRINEILQNGQIYSIYFKTFTIQYSPVS